MPSLLGGAVLVLVFAGQLARLAGCWACSVPYRAVSCGSVGVHVGATVQFLEVRVAWPVLWCRGILYGTVGWARCNTSVFADRSRRACGSRAVSPWLIACSGQGSGGNKPIQVSVEAPSGSLTLLAFWAAGNVSPVTFSQVTCAEAAPAVPLWVPCDLVPSCLTFSVEVRVGSSGARIP